MAGFPGSGSFLPVMPGTAVAAVPASDCLSCAPLRQLLTTCGTCGGQPGGGCSCGGHAQPCTAGEVLNQCGCCQPSGTPQCGSGEHPQPCAIGETVDPQTGCCAPATKQPQCGPGEHAAPCAIGESIDPQTGCCKPMAIEACFVCPGGKPELAIALSGGANSCYIVSETFLPGPLPAQISP